MTFPMWLVISVVVTMYLILPTLLIIFIKNKKLLFSLSLVYFLVFLVCLAFCVFTTVSIGKDKVVLEFVNNGKWCAKKMSFAFQPNKTDILINLAMLFPVGFITASYARYKNKKYFFLIALLIGFCIGGTIELFQFILPVNRSVQLSDIIYNGISGMLGGLFYGLLMLIKKEREANSIEE